MKIQKNIYNWINQRISIDSWIEFFNKPIPKKPDWGYSLGTVFLAVLLVEMMTGIVMSLYYAPTPDHARDSIEYIRTQIIFGKLIFGLHVWGASVIVILAVTYLLHLFSTGGYKRPKELNWILCVLLGLVIFGFLLTGYLLPWDQKSYWGTMVRTHIIESVPGIGPLQAKLLRAGDELGVLTLTRFYSGHVVILPLVFFILLGVYLFLVFKQGFLRINESAFLTDSEEEPFYPKHAIRHLMSVFIFLAILCFVVFKFPAPLDKIADPTDSSYVPRPEWYFLFLNQLLRYCDGPYQFIGTTIIPTAFVLLLFLLPFIDRNPQCPPRQRPFAMGFAGLIFMGIIFLTVQGVLNQPPGDSSKSQVSSLKLKTLDFGQKTLDSVDTAKQGETLISGEQIFVDNKCMTCHRVNKKGGTGASNLTREGIQRNQQWLIDFINNPNTIMKSKQSHPPINISPSEKVLMIAYLSSLTTQVEKRSLKTKNLNVAARISLAMDTSTTQKSLTPKQLVERGMWLYDIQGCDECHTIGDEGGGVQGPDLTFEGRKNHDADWHMRHFADPRSVTPGSKMPKVRLSQEDLKALTAYVLSLQ